MSEATHAGIDSHETLNDMFEAWAETVQAPIELFYTVGPHRHADPERLLFFFSCRRRHTRWTGDWSSDVCSSDLQHHAVSHHRNDPDLIAKKAKIDTYHASLLGYFLEKLHSTKDGDGTLLDHSMIMYGGGLGNGNLHEHTKLPVLMAGKLGGKLKTGQYLNYPANTPMANLLLTVLDKVGAPVQKLGDS